MPNPVSVVIGIHNRADLFKRALDSYVDQDFPDWEMVVVDDRSIDNLGDLLESYRGQIPSIKWLKVDKTRGPRPIGPGTSNAVAVSINLGFKHSSHRRVIRTDPEMIQATRTLWQASELPENDMWYCAIFDIGVVHTDMLINDWEKYRPDPIKLMSLPMEKLHVSWWYMMAVFDREKFCSIRGVDEDFNAGVAGEDDNFYGRIKTVAKCTQHPEVIGIHQYHGGRVWYGTPEHKVNWGVLQRKAQDKNVVTNRDHDWGSDTIINEITIIEKETGGEMAEKKKRATRKTTGKKTEKKEEAPKALGVSAEEGVSTKEEVKTATLVSGVGELWTPKGLQYWLDRLPADKYASMIIPGEYERLYSLALGTKFGGASEGRILEIGSYKGCSTIIMAGASKDAGRQGVLTIDPFNHDGLSPVDVDFFPEWEKNIESAGLTVDVLKGGLQDVTLPGEKFRLILIDGDHARARADYEIVKSYLAPDGWIVLHDIRWGHLDIDKLWEELKAKSKEPRFHLHLGAVKF